MKANENYRIPAWVEEEDRKERAKKEKPAKKEKAKKGKKKQKMEKQDKKITGSSAQKIHNSSAGDEPNNSTTISPFDSNELEPQIAVVEESQAQDLNQQVPGKSIFRSSINDILKRKLWSSRIKARVLQKLPRKLPARTQTSF